ncbi:MAG: elongation factor P [Exilispira sp.]|jgi:elongation factor P|nr:elongation factor P [Exilispira sp.]
MLLANELRKGQVINYNQEYHLVVDYHHHKPGKGNAIVRVKLKNLKKGNIFEYTFNPEEKFDDVPVFRRKAEFLYKDNDFYTFMDNETYEQVQIHVDDLQDNIYYLKEGFIVEIEYIDDKPIFVYPPTFINLTVVETEPGLKGDTVSGGSKPAILETGLKVSVPLFIKVGDVLKIDTRDGSYVERASI